ncbi:WD-40 repeat protein [Parafrankia sp. EAN1pec]|nr:WD-40 repeat protein [Frankia sp. EAN1pec]
MQWALRDSAARARDAHIQVGTSSEGGWYVWHNGFGLRRFEDKAAAWRAVRSLMGRHTGRWEQVPTDPEPFMEAFPPDGSRVLYDTVQDNDLYNRWGDDPDSTWKRFLTAFGKGERLRVTETHALLNGSIELIKYRDPLTGVERFAVHTAREEGVDWHVVDYPDCGPAEAAYRKSVRANADDELPYRSSDVVDVRVDRRSRPPDGLYVDPSGWMMATDDKHEYIDIHGVPSRVSWPPAPPLRRPGPVSAMTTQPRDWDPLEVRVRDVTPAAWLRDDAELQPRSLALIALTDGRRLLASAHDSGAHVWSTGDGAKLCTVSGHSEWVLAVALTALSDGRVVLATGGKDHLARVWSAQDGAALVEIDWHEAPVNTVAWAYPPGDVPWLITGSDDARVRLWDVETQRSVGEFEVGSPRVDLVWSVAAVVLSDGSVCVVAGVEDIDAARVHVWNSSEQYVRSGERTRSHEFVVDCAGSMSSTPAVAVATLVDRSLRVAAIAGSTVRIWDGHTGEVLRTLPAPGDGHGGDVALAVLPDLRVVVAAARGRQTLVWEVESGAVLARVDQPTASFPPIVSLVALPDGGLLLATGRGGGGPARLLQVDPRW